MSEVPCIVKIAHFFVGYKTREQHDVAEERWEGRPAAERVIAEAQRKKTAA